MLQKNKKQNYVSLACIDICGLLLGIFCMVYGAFVIQAKWAVYIIIILAFCLMYESLNRHYSGITCIVLITGFWLLLFAFFFQDSYPGLKTLRFLGALLLSIGHSAHLIRVRKLY